MKNMFVSFNSQWGRDIFDLLSISYYRAVSAHNTVRAVAVTVAGFTMYVGHTGVPAASAHGHVSGWRHIFRANEGGH